MYKDMVACCQLINILHMKLEIKGDEAKRLIRFTSIERSRYLSC